MKKNSFKKAVSITLASLCVGIVSPFPVQAAVENDWEIVDEIE